ncbi:hypothetical protein YC2023_101477 [Brassica napus]
MVNSFRCFKQPFVVELTRKQLIYSREKKSLKHQTDCAISRSRLSPPLTLPHRPSNTPAPGSQGRLSYTPCDPSVLIGLLLGESCRSTLWLPSQSLRSQLAPSLAFAKLQQFLFITMSQSSLLIRNGGSSNGDRNATQLEDDIIRIPECDLNDRARSPTNGSHPSPSETTRYSELNREEKRRRSASSSYQPRETRVTDPRARDRKSSTRQENHYTHHGREVWSRLENPARKKELQGSQRGRTAKHSERNIFRKETSRPSNKPYAEWRPRSFSGEHRNRSGNYLAPRLTEDERMERSRATFDSQKTITDNRVSLESGEFFETHRSDFDAAMAEEERIRRLKGKAIATGPPSPTHKTPQTLNRVNQGIILTSPVKPTDASQVQRYDQPLLEQEDAILELEEGLDQALDVPLTELESTEVDNLVLETERLEMAEKMMAENNIDENMIDLDNDDLLGDELLGETPDLVDAEKIEAISQLSPANAVSKKAASMNKQMERAKTATYIQEEALASGSGLIDGNSNVTIIHSKNFDGHTPYTMHGTAI